TTRRPRRSPLFPYTTLFRSTAVKTLTNGLDGRPGNIGRARHHMQAPQAAILSPGQHQGLLQAKPANLFATDRRENSRLRGLHVRSEEHTSELQSRENLVCRL